MKNCFSILFLILIWLPALPQEKPFVHSNAHVQTTYHGNIFFSSKESAVITYDETNKELRIKIDFKLLKTGVDSLDEWLADLENNTLLFKTVIDPELFPNQGSLAYRNIKTVGTFYFNNQQLDNDISLIIFEANDQGMLYADYSNNKYDRFRVRLKLDVVPKDFKLNKLKHHLKNTISIYIGNGVINLIKH